MLICDGNGDPMCIAGVYGGKDSGVTDTTVNIFLESAWFNPASVRRTSFRHNLRTESASHFEKEPILNNVTKHYLEPHIL